MLMCKQEIQSCDYITTASSAIPSTNKKIGISHAVCGEKCLKSKCWKKKHYKKRIHTKHGETNPCKFRVKNKI